ncbi:MAG: cobalamin-binding protein [Pirellulales bacterium]|nr:cobalamin-binding protein [Pirellulales bacterium]
MRSKILLIVVILLVFLACHIAKQRLARIDPPVDSTGGTTNETTGQSSIQTPRQEQPRRIVSMAPSITEILFALKLGDRVVGVSNYCNYPAEAKKIDRIGGVMDPNLEAVVALKPDLVVMLHGNKALCPSLERLGIKTLLVDHKTIRGVLESIPTIGQSCGNTSAARKMTDDLRARIEQVRQKTSGLRRPKVMVSVIRRLGTGRLEDVYVAGNDRYFDEMIEIAGGQNVFADQPVRYPVVSNESIIKANPEIIIDIVSSVSDISSADDKKSGKSYINEMRAKTLADWQQLSDVDAVASGKVYYLDENYISVPGPRFILVLEKLQKLLHPEAD